MTAHMREIHIADPATADEVVETLRRDVVMVQMPTVFVLLAPPNSDGVERLNRQAKAAQQELRHCTRVS